jgi:hypothetical protein
MINKYCVVIVGLLLVFSSINASAEKVDIKSSKEAQIFESLKNHDKIKFKSEVLTNSGSKKYFSKQKAIQIEADYQNKNIKFVKENQQEITISLPKSIDEKNESFVDNKQIYSVSNNSDIISEVVDGGIRQIINITSADAPNIYDFKVTGIKNGNIIIDQEQAAIVDENNKVLITVGKPWATDNTGKELKTWYEILDKTTLRQHIDIKNAVFPVIADPLWCGSAIFSSGWIYREGFWSSSITPTGCGGWNYGGLYANSLCWSEYYNSVNTCAQYSGNTCVTLGWNKSTNIGSMYNQFVCHAEIAKGIKVPWNIEPAKSDKGYNGFVLSGCN